MQSAHAITAAEAEFTTNANSPSTGSLRVTVVGVHIGHVHGSVMSRLGQSSSTATRWQSTSIIISKSASGINTERYIAMTIGWQVKSLTASMTIDALSPSSISATNAATSGAASVTIVGVNTALQSYSSRVGTSALPATQWQSDSAIKIKQAAGIKSHGRVLLTTGWQMNSLTSSNSIDVPATSNAMRTNIAASGSMSITVISNNLGFTNRVRFGGTADDVTVWSSDTSLASKGSTSVSTRPCMLLTAGRQVNSLTASMTIDALVASSTATTNVTVAASGAMSVTVLGVNVGTPDYSSPSRLGGSSSEMTLWRSECSIVTKTTSAIWTERRMTMTMGWQSNSLTASLTMDAPGTSSATIANVAASGAMIQQPIDAWRKSIRDNIVAIGEQRGRQSSDGRVDGTPRDHDDGLASEQLDGIIDDRCIMP